MLSAICSTCSGGCSFALPAYARIALTGTRSICKSISALLPPACSPAPSRPCFHVRSAPARLRSGRLAGRGRVGCARLKKQEEGGRSPAHSPCYHSTTSARDNGDNFLTDALWWTSPRLPPPSRPPSFPPALVPVCTHTRSPACSPALLRMRSRVRVYARVCAPTYARASARSERKCAFCGLARPISFFFIVY